MTKTKIWLLTTIMSLVFFATSQMQGQVRIDTLLFHPNQICGDMCLQFSVNSGYTLLSLESNETGSFQTLSASRDTILSGCRTYRVGVYNNANFSVSYQLYTRCAIDCYALCNAVASFDATNHTVKSGFYSPVSGGPSKVIQCSGVYTQNNGYLVSSLIIDSGAVANISTFTPGERILVKNGARLNVINSHNLTILLMDGAVANIDGCHWCDIYCDEESQLDIVRITQSNVWGDSTAIVTSSATTCNYYQNTLWQQSSIIDSLLWCQWQGFWNNTVLPCGNVSLNITGLNPNPCCLNSISLTVDSMVCHPTTTSVAMAVPGNGTLPYSFVWENGYTNSFRNLTLGLHSITVTDSRGCSASKSVNVRADTVSVYITGDSIICGSNPSDFAVITANPTSSYGSGFQYSWPGNNYSNRTIYNGGTYNVTVTDSHGCTATAAQPFVVIEPNYTKSIGRSSATACIGDTMFMWVVTDPTNINYSVLWGSGETTDTIVMVATTAGTMSRWYIMTDRYGCAYSASNSIAVHQPMTINASYVQKCTGISTTITTAISGTTGANSYIWSTGQTTATIAVTSPGNYIVTLTNGGCKAIDSTISVNFYPLPIAEITAADTVFCSSQNSTLLTTAAGYASYIWYGGSPSSPSNTRIAASGGTYGVTVTSVSGCTATDIIYVYSYAPPVVNLSGVSTSECVNTGTAIAYVSGGTAPYTYLWNTGATTNYISGLSSGTYTVSVSNAACTVILQRFVGISQITANTTGNSVCPQGLTGTTTATGSVTLSLVSGGTAPYTYLWNTGATTQNVTGLLAGTYDVTITDANGCTTTRNATVNTHVWVTPSYTVVNQNCNGYGRITVSPALNYGYVWSNGSSHTNWINSINGPIDYYLTITDFNGCRDIDTINVGLDNTIVFNWIVTGPTCYSGNNSHNGQIVNQVSGIWAPSYNWSSGTNQPSLNNLNAGAYIVTVTNYFGCNAVDTVIVPSKVQLVVDTMLLTGPLCFGQTCNATVVASGGTAPYSYVWSGGSGTGASRTLGTGSFTVTVRDNITVCPSAIETFTITQPAELLLSVTGNNTSSASASDGTATVNVTGGTPSYTYLWNNGQNTATATGLSAGTYIVTVTDANGCDEIASITVNDPILGSITIETENNITVYPNPTSGLVRVQTTSSVIESLTAYNTLGQRIESQNTESIDLYGLPAGTYLLEIIFTDGRMCRYPVIKY